MDSFITVTPGGPPADQDLPDGVYQFILTAISDPKTVTARRGQNAGKDIDLIDWTFAVNQPGHAHDSRELVESTSTASGPKSKMYAWLTALFGGVAPQVGQKIGKDDLIGRQAYGTVVHDEGGWPRLQQLSAIPPHVMQQQFAQVTGTPVQPQGAPAPAAAGPAPLREQVAVGAGAGDGRGDLPF